MDTSKLWVIAVISNPVRYQSRIDLFNAFKRRMDAAGVNLVVVEMAFGDRFFTVTDSTNPRHVQLRSEHELWHKENMIRAGIERLPWNWEYVAWIDADITFMRDPEDSTGWVTETVHQLQHYHVVQMFQHAIDLGPNGETLKVHNGFAYNYLRGVQDVDSKGYGYGYVGHPGYAWACTRHAWDSIGGIQDAAILGAGDHHFALSLIGRVEASFPPKISQGYRDPWLQTQLLAEKFLARDIGCVPGSIVHHWHGKKKDRKYVERWEILTSNDFDPRWDLRRDYQGLWQLAGNKIKLRDQIRGYMRARNEDSVDLE